MMMMMMMMMMKKMMIMLFWSYGRFLPAASATRFHSSSLRTWLLPQWTLRWGFYYEDFADLLADAWHVDGVCVKCFCADQVDMSVGCTVCHPSHNEDEGSCEWLMLAPSYCGVVFVFVFVFAFVVVFAFDVVVVFVFAWSKPAAAAAFTQKQAGRARVHKKQQPATSNQQQQHQPATVLSQQPASCWTAHQQQPPPSPSLEKKKRV
jgi:hypothetical protein